MNILALMMPAYRENGGIAEYNRVLLDGLSQCDVVEQVTYIARKPHSEKVQLPPKFVDFTSSSASRLSYLLAFWRALFGAGKPAYILCAHIYLLPLAYLAKLFTGAKIVLCIYGIEVWQPPKKLFVSLLISQIDACISCSEYSQKRFEEWASLSEKVERYILPGSVDTDRFFPKSKSVDLVGRHNLKGKKVLLTLARLHPVERYKGIDEVLEALPQLSGEFSDLVYLIVGQGDDRSRLEAKARELGVEDMVVFTGYIGEEEKADYYRLADLFVMPGSGEGFGLVYLEALACGVPAVGSLIDASAETLRGGELGLLADPKDPQSVLDAIRAGLREEAPQSDSLEDYTRKRFIQRVGNICVALNS